MIKNLFLLLLSATFFKSSFCLYGNFLAEASDTLKEILVKWENKELDLSLGCAQQLTQVLQNLFSFDDGLWALKMIDATGKFPAGLAEGSVVEMGNFDECLNVESVKKNVTGNYCSITVDISSFDFLSLDQTQSGLVTRYKKIRKMEGEYGICLPNKCSSDDLRNAIHLLTTFIPLDIRCQTKDDVIPPLDAGAIVTIVVFGVVIALMLFSTAIDYFCQGKEIKAHPILISFSIYTNGQNLFRMRSSGGELSCLHGIRFLSICWIILGHIFFSNVFGPTVNLFEVLRYLGKTDSMLYLNCAHAVDTFFVLSGLLVSYNFMKNMKKGEKFNIFKYYIHRYLRLTPAYAVVILSSVYLVKYLGSGPLYYKIDTVVSQLCRDHWWQALLYLQNYLTDAADICVSQSWFLNVDYQLYLISPIFLFLLYKTPRVGTIITLLPIVGCMVAGYIITSNNSLPVVSVIGNTKFMTYYYIKTHTRAATWFIGALLGYFLGRIKFYNDKSYLKIPRIIILLTWLVVLAMIPFCIFGFHDMISSEEYDVVGNSMYNAFVRPTWALCVSWVIFACSIGYGGIINDFLSLPIFGILSKFTYSIYLVHLTILYVMIHSIKIPAHFSVEGMMNQFCSVFAVSFLVAVFWVLAFEMPILVIEPYIFGGRGLSAKRNNQNVKSRITPRGERIEIQP